MLPRRDEAREVRHVDEQERAGRVGDLTEAREIEDPRVRRRAGDDEPRMVLVREALELVVVEQLVLFADRVGDEVVELAREVHRRSVREVATLVEREPQHGVAGLQDRGVRGHVGLRARVRLHVRVRGSEQRLRALDRERFRDVDPLAAAVVTPPGIALGVLVGEDAADGLHHGGAGVVLRRDELDLLDLPASLAFDGGIDLRVDSFQCVHRPRPIPLTPSAVTGALISSFAICPRRRA